jgi:peptide/nickel transport system substrate-binding protein
MGRGVLSVFLSAARFPAAWCLVLLAASGTAAQGRGGELGASPDGGAYRRPLANDPVTLDPARIRDVYSLTVVHQLFDGLVQFDQTLTIAPALAEFWKASRDGLTWTFTLRRGVKFHHGREVTADDVIYSLTRLIDPQMQSGAADLFLNIRGAPEFRQGKTKEISGLAAPDPYTVQVTLTEAPVPFVSVLGVGSRQDRPT